MGDTLIPSPSADPLTITHPFLMTSSQLSGVLAQSAINSGRGWPVLVPFACRINRMRIGVAASSGNVCVAIYDANGARVTTSGSVACGGIGKQDITVPEVILQPGLYYFHLAADNTTATFEATQNDGSPGRVIGGYQDANFPAPATLANGVDDNATGYAFIVTAYHS